MKWSVTDDVQVQFDSTSVSKESRKVINGCSETLFLEARDDRGHCQGTAVVENSSYSDDDFAKSGEKYVPTSSITAECKLNTPSLLTLTQL